MSLGQDVSQGVQLLAQLSHLDLQLLVFLLQLQGPLLGQQDPAPGLVPALPHRDVVPLPPQTVLGAVLADGPLGHGGPEGRQQEGGEVLLGRRWVRQEVEEALVLGLVLGLTCWVVV